MKCCDGGLVCPFETFAEITNDGDGGDGGDGGERKAGGAGDGGWIVMERGDGGGLFEIKCLVKWRSSEAGWFGEGVLFEWFFNKDGPLLDGWCFLEGPFAIFGDGGFLVAGCDSESRGFLERKRFGEGGGG